MPSRKCADPSSKILYAGLAALLAATAVTMLPTAAFAEQPRLILQITVDALRGDLHRRFDSVLGDGGFRYLAEHGVDYVNAHY